MSYTISQLFSIFWVIFESLIALGGVGGTVYLVVVLDDILVNIDDWLTKIENGTKYVFDDKQDFIESIRTMAITGIVMAIVPVIYFAFELWGTMAKKDWIIIGSCSIRICLDICVLLLLICGTVILLILGILERDTSDSWFQIGIGFVAGLSFLFLYNSARIVLQIYLSKSLRNKEKNHTNVRDRTKKKRKVVPITNDDLDKTHVMTVKEAKKKPDQGDKKSNVEKKVETNDDYVSDEKLVEKELNNLNFNDPEMKRKLKAAGILFAEDTSTNILYP